MDELYFREPFVSKLEELRDLARGNRQITYDCFHAILREGKVVCAKRNLKRSVPLLTVLKGRSTVACADCVDFDG